MMTTNEKQAGDPVSAILSRPKPYMLAHRGDSNHAPENSLAAFRLAVEAGAEMVETDLWFTRDGQIVCHHDPTLQRMTGRPERVTDMTTDEIRRLRLRSRFDALFPDERLPTLDDVLDLLPPSVGLVVELKDPRFASPEWAGKLARQAAERVAERTIMAISFHGRLLWGVRRAEPAFQIAHIPVVAPFPIQQVDAFGPIWPLLALNPGYVAWVHRRGKWLCPLDPQPHKRLRWYLRLGVDAILTDDPAETRARIDRLRTPTKA